MYPNSEAKRDGTLASFVPFGVVGLGVFQVGSAFTPDACPMGGCRTVHPAEHVAAGVLFLGIGAIQITGTVLLFRSFGHLAKEDQWIPDYAAEEAIVVIPSFGPNGGSLQLVGRW